MNVRQELLTAIEQLPDEQLSALLNVALCLRENNFDETFQLSTLQFESEAYQGWVSSENDIYEEIFANAATTE